MFRLSNLAEIGDSSALTRQLIDMKRDLSHELAKCNELAVNSNYKVANEDEKSSSDDGESDDEFIDVEDKEGSLPN